MKTLLKLEEAALFGLSIWFFSRLGIPWWWFPALILAPDLSMSGYLGGPAAGAFFYNLFHHKAFALLVYGIGIYAGMIWVQLAGIILFGHSSMDRVMGYGLKYPDSFQNTHLGRIGKG
jgi:hypothetical protein